jgi:DMSO/TMAO reductase YedYZ molybdopterin-dependent catalytic subunit
MTASISPVHAWSASIDPHHPPRWICLAGGVAAATVAGLAMLVLRSTLQVRSVPERVLEWLLLFVPLDLFESALQRFGFSAKRYALFLAVAIMLGLLTWLGYVALKRRWSLVVLIALGLGLWLFTMLVIMPLTSAGFFALALLEGKLTNVLSYLAIGLLYSTLLCLVHAYVLAPEQVATRPVQVPGLTPSTALSPRRWALSVMGGSVAVLAATYLQDLLVPKRSGLPTIVVADPQEPVPSGGLEEPNPHPNAVAAAEPTPAPVAQPGPAAKPAVVASATPSGTTLPEPGLARSLKRDQDGAVLPSGRRPGELAEPITSNESFYVVTKNAGGDPVVHPNDWRLVVDGEVQRPFELDYAALRKLPSVEVTKTLECISNLVAECQLAPFGCDLISTARWRGVRLLDILNLVGGIKPGAEFVATISADEYTTALPLQAVMSPEALLVFEMNGQVLPREHGYPARVLLPGRYGMKSAKWVVALRPMRREFVDWYGQRNWSREALVKTMTRIDVPNRDARLAPGPQRIAGVAYAGARGVMMVEFSADGGDSWEIADPVEQLPGSDVWMRWEGTFNLLPGTEATLIARATDGTGQVQPEPFSLAQPDGASGWNTITVKAQ